MNRAERKRLEKALNHPDAKLVVLHTAEHVANEAVEVLNKEFGFGPKRIERFLDFLVKGSSE